MSLKEHWGREKAAFHQIKDTESFCNFGARFLQNWKKKENKEELQVSL